jgi:hypothetical protein
VGPQFDSDDAIAWNTTTKPIMALVQYPDSDSDQELDTQGAPSQLIASAPKGAVKRKHSEFAQDDDLPPLPAAFHDLYSTNARASTSDDPSLHGGRKRTIPHVEGKWPSHVYLECENVPPSLLAGSRSTG